MTTVATTTVVIKQPDAAVTVGGRHVAAQLQSAPSSTALVHRQSRGEDVSLNTRPWNRRF